MYDMARIFMFLGFLSTFTAAEETFRKPIEEFEKFNLNDNPLQFKTSAAIGKEVNVAFYSEKGNYDSLSFQLHVKFLKDSIQYEFLNCDERRWNKVQLTSPADENTKIWTILKINNEINVICNTVLLITRICPVTYGNWVMFHGSVQKLEYRMMPEKCEDNTCNSLISNDICKQMPEGEFKHPCKSCATECSDFCYDEPTFIKFCEHARSNRNFCKKKVVEKNCQKTCNKLCFKASCFNNVKNGNEEGIDCGGDCPICEKKCEDKPSLVKMCKETFKKHCSTSKSVQKYCPKTCGVCR